MANRVRGIDGQAVFITGAARGIGAESARRLAAKGAKVALVGLEPEQLEAVAAQCGPEAIWIEADVTDSAALESAVSEAVERFGGLDCVMANAGVGSPGFARSIDPDHWERVIEVNLLGVWRTVRACLPHVIERRGYVLVVASLAAALHGPGMGSYTASKAGAEAFADSLRAEVKHLGVDVGVGYFSWIDTEMVAGGDRHPAMIGFRDRLPGPFRKTYPVSAVGDAVAEGVEARRRWITVPNWLRVLLPFRGMLGPLMDRGSADTAAEMDERFAQDVAERGAESASRLVGAGGAAAERTSAVNRT
jgi:NAD(P)-dependent dehydrogenase (short-subunit alcohol dehydrogenase family)